MAEREAERYKALAAQFQIRVHELGGLVHLTDNSTMEDSDEDDDDGTDNLSLESNDEDEITSLMDFSVTDVPAAVQARRVSIAEDD